MKSKKNNDIEEMIDIVKVEQSKTPDYQGALDRLKSIDLDYVSRMLNSEQLENVSDYSIHDYPRLEMMGDIETLQNLINGFDYLGTAIKSINKTSDEMFKKSGLSAWICNDENYELYENEENEELDTFVALSKTRFYKGDKTEIKNELELYFYPDEGFDFDKLAAAAKKRMEEKGWLK